MSAHFGDFQVDKCARRISTIAPSKKHGPAIARRDLRVVDQAAGRRATLPIFPFTFF